MATPEAIQSKILPWRNAAFRQPTCPLTIVPARSCQEVTVCDFRNEGNGCIDNRCSKPQSGPTPINAKQPANQLLMSTTYVLSAPVGPAQQNRPDDIALIRRLLNNFIIHKISDSAVISRMQKSIGSIDASLWNRVPRLAPGQALASFASFARPLMVAIDPAPCKRLLVD